MLTLDFFINYDLYYIFIFFICIYVFYMFTLSITTSYNNFITNRTKFNFKKNDSIVIINKIHLLPTKFIQNIDWISTNVKPLSTDMACELQSRLRWLAVMEYRQKLLTNPKLSILLLVKIIDKFLPLPTKKWPTDSNFCWCNLDGFTIIDHSIFDWTLTKIFVDNETYWLNLNLFQ